MSALRISTQTPQSACPTGSASGSAADPGFGIALAAALSADDEAGQTSQAASPQDGPSEPANDSKRGVSPDAPTSLQMVAAPLLFAGLLAPAPRDTQPCASGSGVAGAPSPGSEGLVAPDAGPNGILTTDRSTTWVKPADPGPPGAQAGTTRNVGDTGAGVQPAEAGQQADDQATGPVAGGGARETAAGARPPGSGLLSAVPPGSLHVAASGAVGSPSAPAEAGASDAKAGPGGPAANGAGVLNITGLAAAMQHAAAAHGPAGEPGRRNRGDGGEAELRASAAPSSGGTTHNQHGAQALVSAVAQVLQRRDDQDATQSGASDPGGAASPVDPPATGEAARIEAAQTPDAPEQAGAGVARSAAPVLAAMAGRLVKSADGGATSFEFRISPPELGWIEAKLEIGGEGDARATITVQRPDTLGDMIRASRELERAFADLGLKLSADAISFRLAADSGTGGWAGGHEQLEHRPNRYGQGAGNDGEETVQEIGPIAERWRKARLDIWA